MSARAALNLLCKAIGAAEGGVRAPSSAVYSVHDSDHGSMHAAQTSYEILEVYGLVGAIGRHTPNENTYVESFVKMPKVDVAYPMACNTFIDVADRLPRFVNEVYNSWRLHSALGHLSLLHIEGRHIQLTVKSVA
jgi:putative transposase